ncbi:MAG: DUF2691 family protein [Rummeliibacillus sp.]|uniref:DUF2691 family protein n=1 Tax=Rummeliibacillus sp. POC4 TaxID=2305899 RepID=UPI001314CD7F|nr:DUF2691 family protein [Rummeliibacillus sp. POC4]
MHRGILFEIPNTYGFYLRDIIQMIDMQNVLWRAMDVESYFTCNNDLGEPLFETNMILSNEQLLDHLKKEHYTIFVDLKAFPRNSTPTEISSYEEFTSSQCEVVLLIIDSCYVSLYMKDRKKLQEMYEEVIGRFENVEYITDDNDSRYSLIAF